MSFLTTLTATPDTSDPDGAYLSARTSTGDEVFAYARKTGKSWKVSQWQTGDEVPLDDQDSQRARAAATGALRRLDPPRKEITLVLGAEHIPAEVTCLRPRNHTVTGEDLFRSPEDPGSWFIGTERAVALREGSLHGAISLRHDDFPAQIIAEDAAS